MRLLVETCLGSARDSELQIVDISEDAAVGEFLNTLGIDESQRLYLGGEILDRTTSLRNSIIVDGVTIGDRPTPAPISSQLASGTTVVIKASNGPQRVLQLSGDEWTVGREPHNTIAVDDSAVSSRHLVVKAASQGVAVTDLGSTNGTFVAGKQLPVNVESLVAWNTEIEVGTSTITFSRLASLQVNLERDSDGGVLFNRPSRIRQPHDTFVIRLPDEISEQQAQFDLLQSAAPGATSLMYGSFIPIIGTGVNIALQKRRQKLSKKEFEAKKAEYEAKVQEITDSIAAEIASQKASWLRSFPNPDDVLRIATEPSERLWERRALDVDALQLRVGIGTQPADIEFEHRGDRQESEKPVIEGAPVVVNLSQVGVLGIAGFGDTPRQLGFFLLGQLAAFRPPRDLLTVVLTAPTQSSAWGWFPWLPHGSQERLETPFLIGNTEQSIQDRVNELINLLEERTELASENPGALFTPDVVIMLDGARLLRATPGVTRLLREGPKLGIYAIAMDEDRSRLPEEVRGEVILDSHGHASVKVEGERVRGDIVVDQVNVEWIATLARSLTPFRLVDTESGGDVPNGIRFVDMVSLDLDDPNDVVQRWAKEGRTTNAWVGASATGALVLDLQRDGPHALVAGTTGAGKSEFLQTLIASLAIVNRPDTLNFVLVDYKGASAFAECEALPHTVGMVTNLDGHLTQRALTSLDAELHRREEQLREMGANDINAAWKLDARRAAEVGLARLVLIIDEFAELVHELPDFVTGLIRIARVGRSLGIHLVLATQRPTGVVTPEMKANTGLRVALRMQDKGDSSEVLDAPNAASISRMTPGRGYVRTGSTGQLTEFQTARVGGARPGADAARHVPRRASLNWGNLGLGLSFPKVEQQSTSTTDLGAVVSLVRSAAEKVQYAQPRRPWLDPLLALVVNTELRGPSAVTLDRQQAIDEAMRLRAPVGLIDAPADQAQYPLWFELTQPSSWGIAGGPQTGKTSALLGIASSLAATLDTSEVHLYGLDFGGGSLMALEELPHCGSVIRSIESERMTAWIAKLGDEHRRRQSDLASGGFSTLDEMRASQGSQPTPYIVVLIDRWENVLQEFPPESGSTVSGDLARLIREGTGTGIRFVLSGDRALLSDRVASHLTHRFALSLSDVNDYRQIDIQPRDVPSDMAPGRALLAGSGVEVQFGIWPQAFEIPNREALRAMAGSLNVTPATGQLRVDVLPDKISLEQATSLPSAEASSSGAPLAVGGDTLSVFSITVSQLQPGFLIAGPRKSGKTTAAVNLVRGAVDEGLSVHIWAGMSKSVYETQFGDAITYLDESALMQVPEDMNLREGRHLVVIDDSDRFFRSALDGHLVETVSSGADVRVVITGAIEDFVNDLRGVSSLCKRSQTGLILQPQSSIDGQVFGQRIDKSLLGGNQGRAQLFLLGQQYRVQVLAK